MFFRNNGKRVIEITKILRGLLAQEPPCSPHRKIMRGAIMGYELGDIQKYTTKDSQHNLPVNIKKGLEENAKLGMADIIIQCRMLCLDCHWNFDEIQELGLEHLKERHLDFERDGYGE